MVANCCLSRGESSLEDILDGDPAAAILLCDFALFKLKVKDESFRGTESGDTVFFFLFQ